MSRRKLPQRKASSHKWIYVSVMIVLVAAFGIAIWNGNASEPQTRTLGPRLAVNQDRIDLGRQPFDKIVQVRFELINDGDQTLMLDASAPIRVIEGC